MKPAASRLVAGVMSGSSADGVDVALVRIGPRWQWELIGFEHTPFLPRDRAAILRVAAGEATLAELARLDVWLGRRIGEAVLGAVRAAGRGARPELIACHGQTVYHQGRVATLQVGDAATVANLTGVAVVSDFRSADIAAGGEGAPLVPWVDWRLFTHRHRYRAVLNLGGIANLTLLPPGARAAEVMGFDTGPANMALDAFMAMASGGRLGYDRDGRLARQGKVNRRWLTHLLAHRYFVRHPPKSAGREQFGADFVRQALRHAPRLRQADGMATLVALTAETVAQGLRRAGRTGVEVIVSGGGTENQALMESLTRAAPGCTWLRPEQFGIPSQAKEALAFAFLGEAHHRGVAANLPQVTGADRAVVLGSYTPTPRRGRVIRRR